MVLEKADFIGAILAQVIFILIILVFISRLIKKSHLEYGLGLILILTALPLIYLLATAPLLERRPLYYVQIILMLVFLIMEILLDYILKINFREVRWMVISYVVIFFAGTGGMIGVASHAGRGWTLSSIILFLIMASLSFIQRAITGF
jgi:hypothetical protein